MYLFIKRFFSIGLIFGLGYVFCIGIIGSIVPEYLQFNLRFPHKDGYSYTRFNTLEHTKDLDILFLGSSHAYRGFDTRYYTKKGYKCFNMGSSSQSPIQTQVLLNEHLSRLNPRIIIYEICPSDLSSDGIESSLDFIANYKWSMDILSMSLRQCNLKLINGLIYKVWFSIVNREDTHALASAIDSYIEGGFVEKQSNEFNPSGVPTSPEPINQQQANALENILKTIRASPAHILTLQAPSLIENQTFSNQTEYLLKNYGDFKNLNDSLLLDTSYFYDEHHLNRKGVKIFNEKILDYLAQANLAAKSVSPAR